MCLVKVKNKAKKKKKAKENKTKQAKQNTKLNIILGGAMCKLPQFTSDIERERGKKNM